MAKTTIQQVLKIDGAFLANREDREERLGNAAHALLEAAGKLIGFDFNEITSAEEFSGEPWTHIGFYASLKLADGKTPTVRQNVPINPLKTVAQWSQAIAFNLRLLLEKAGALAGFTIPDATYTVGEEHGAALLTVEFVVRWTAKEVPAEPAPESAVKAPKGKKA